MALVTVATVLLGTLGLRFSRTTSDFYVASRSAGRLSNASAIGGEYLSAASFLGVAGLVLAYGVDMLWYPVGWTAGYLVLLTLVAAPLRRSGAYTLPDFAEVRLESLPVRRLASSFVILISWLYLIPQLQGAGLTLKVIAGAPEWVGIVLVGVVVLLNVLSGGMRSITFVQAFQYWLKLTALFVPLVFLLTAWRGNEPDAGRAALHDTNWLLPLQSHPHALYLTYSIIVATFLGTMGLPHVVLRFYTNPDGTAARRTTLLVLGLLGFFYLMPALYGVLGRMYAGDLARAGRFDTVVLVLPSRLLGTDAADLFGALLAAGAFAAFLSTSSGLTVAVAGVVSQDILGGRSRGVRAFRIATALGVAVALLLALASRDISVASTVGWAFAIAASTFCPLLILGIWWPRLTGVGAATGLVIGGLASGTAVALTMINPDRGGWLGALLTEPAAWSVPLAFATMIVGSLLTPHRVPPNVARTMVRLHTPESLDVDRGSWHPERRVSPS